MPHSLNGGQSCLEHDDLPGRMNDKQIGAINHDTMSDLRLAFLSSVSSAFPPSRPCSVLLLTHLLGDRPAFVRVLAKSYRLAGIVAIPYSIEQNVFDLLSQSYDVHKFTLEEMLRAQVLFDLVESAVAATHDPIAVMEIGGYFAPIGNALKQRFGAAYIGSVEDTENGHRRYEQISDIRFPVVSVARSKLKRLEDRLIGVSVVFSLERVLRSMGQVLTGMTVGVLGYGPVGASVAKAAGMRNANVLVYDVAPHLRVAALADGFRIPEREALFRSADIVVGATGMQSINAPDFELLKNGAVLASASSKAIEIDVQGLIAAASETTAGPLECKRFRLTNKRVYLLAAGTPINFVDGAVVGPLINLVQAEMLVAAKTLLEIGDRTGILEVSSDDQERLATIWLDHFVDTKTTGAPVPSFGFPSD
jgi:adenosylhomocysteinase